MLQRRAALSVDSLLGLLAHSALAIGLVVLAFLSWVRVDLLGFLFGDILAVSKPDIAVVYGGGALALAGLAFIWRPLFAATVNRELAERFEHTEAAHDGAEYHFHATIELGGQPADVYRQIYAEYRDTEVNLKFIASEIAMFYYDDTSARPGSFITYKVLSVGG